VLVQPVEVVQELRHGRQVKPHGLGDLAVQRVSTHEPGELNVPSPNLVHVLAEVAGQPLRSYHDVASWPLRPRNWTLSAITTTRRRLLLYVEDLSLRP
jgi:hypothetical protein